MPDAVPVVLTTVLASDSDWAKAEWERILRLGEARPPFLVGYVRCDLDENIRRIQSPPRDGKRKPRDPEMARRNHQDGKALLGAGAARLLELDRTSQTAEEAAKDIVAWAASV